jgi:hypothetical protein
MMCIVIIADLIVAPADPDGNKDSFADDTQGWMISQTRTLDGRDYNMQTLSFDALDRPPPDAPDPNTGRRPTRFEEPNIFMTYNNNSRCRTNMLI